MPELTRNVCPGASAAWLAGAALLLLNVAAFAQAPDLASERAFFAANPTLQFIEQRLPAPATVVIPPDAAHGRHVATDAELRATFVRLLDEFLSPPATFAAKTRELIAEVCRYRPAQLEEWVTAAADVLLQHLSETTGQELENAVASAVAVNPRAAGAIVARALRSISIAVESSSRPLALADASRYAGGVVLAAVAAARDRSEPGSLIRNIVESALIEARLQQASYLAIDSVAACARAAKAIDRALLAELCQSAFSKFGRSREEVGLICGGVLRGAGIDDATALKDYAALTLSVPLAAFGVVVVNAFVAMSSANEISAIIPKLITAANADFIPAVVIGASIAKPDAAVDILRAGLNRDLVLHGRTTIREIVDAAFLGCAQRSVELAAAAVGYGDLSEGNAPAQIAEAVARSVLPSQIAPALAAQIAAQPARAEEIRATVAGAMTGAAVPRRKFWVSTIAFLASAGTGLAADVLEQGIISAPPELQYAAVLGTLAASPANARELLDRALAHADLLRSQAGPVATGGALVIEIQKAPGSFYRAALARLAARETATPEMVQAIILATALANPRGASAVAAAAVAITALPPAAIVATAARGDEWTAGRIARAVDTAAEVKSDPANLYRIVRHEFAATPEHAPEIVTGAMAAAPSLGHVVAEAAAPAGAAAAIIPRLFAFSAVANPLAPRSEPVPEALAGLVDGAIRGSLRARLDAASERDAVSATVVASVRSVAALARDPAAAVPLDQALAAVIGAAARAAGIHALEIARAAGRSERALFGEAADPAKIRDAVVAARPPIDTPKIGAAVSAGFAETDSQVVAPGARALIDYAHDALTGPPMTRFRDL